MNLDEAIEKAEYHRLGAEALLAELDRAEASRGEIPGEAPPSWTYIATRASVHATLAIYYDQAAEGLARE